MAEPNFMDVATPTDETQWSTEELKIIQDNYDYHWKMISVINEISHGGTNVSLPKKPKTDIASLLGMKQKKISNVLYGTELHHYLVKHLCKKEIMRVPFVEDVVNSKTTLEEITRQLICGYEIVKSTNTKTLSSSIIYGKWLNVAFELHNRDHISGKTADTWKIWLEKNIGIQDSYARKLREIANICANYSRFSLLGLSFSEVYKRRKEIVGMLSTDRTLADFWRDLPQENTAPLPGSSTL